MVQQIAWQNIVDLLTNGKEQIVIIMPAVHEEWIAAIQQNEHLSNLSLKVCIDNSEEVIRHGYGSVKSIEQLKQLGAELKECPGLRVNLILVDESAYCLFIESRIIAGDPKGYNAISLDRGSAQTIISQFFPKPQPAHSSLEQPSGEAKVIAVPLVEEKAKAVAEAIKKNPPDEPDLRRQINTYTTLFQYAEVHFEGANLQSKTITIPPTALPFRDADLKKRMKTKFNLFGKEETKSWAELLDMKQKVEELREKYLTPCKLKRDRSILKKDDKVAFVREFEALKKNSEEAVKNITDAVQKAIHASKDILKQELTNFLMENQPEDVKIIKSQSDKEKMVDDYVNEMLAKTKVPSAHSLVKGIKLDAQYAELTVEDLRDQPFIKWFKEKGLITEENEKSIAEYKKAFAIRR